jgi:hypothetical protein
VPLVFGLTRSTLVWPESFFGHPRQLQRAVIAHELAHLRRRDLWTDLLVVATGCIWWWNPVFWRVRRKLRESAELACDRWAIDATSAERSSYGRVLIDLAGSGRRVGAGLASTGGRRALERRLLSLCQRPQRRAASVGALAASALVLLGTLTGAAWSRGVTAAGVASPPADTVLGVYSRGRLSWDERGATVRPRDAGSWLYLFSTAEDGATSVYWSGWRSAGPEEGFRSFGAGAPAGEDPRGWLREAASGISLADHLRTQAEEDPEGLHAWSYAVVPEASHSNRERGLERAALWWRRDGELRRGESQKPGPGARAFALGTWQESPDVPVKLLLLGGSNRGALIDGIAVEARGVRLPSLLERILDAGWGI